jgi:hypothetical protein
VKHEDDEPNTPVPALYPVPDPDDTDELPPPPATFRDTTTEDRIARSVAVALEPRFESLANAIIGMREAVRDEVRVTVTILDEKHNLDMADHDRKWDDRTTRVEGHIKSLAKVVGEAFSAFATQLDKLGNLVKEALPPQSSPNLEDVNGGKSHSTR